MGSIDFESAPARLYCDNCVTEACIVEALPASLLPAPPTRVISPADGSRRKASSRLSFRADALLQGRTPCLHLPLQTKSPELTSRAAFAFELCLRATNPAKARVNRPGEGHNAPVLLLFPWIWVLRLFPTVVFVACNPYTEYNLATLCSRPIAWWVKAIWCQKPAEQTARTHQSPAGDEPSAANG